MTKRGAEQRVISEPVAEFVARHALKPLSALDNTCPHCHYDEAEGGLISHCDACCRKIVIELWAYRQGLRARLSRAKRRGKR